MQTATKPSTTTKKEEEEKRDSRKRKQYSPIRYPTPPPEKKSRTTETKKRPSGAGGEKGANAAVSVNCTPLALHQGQYIQIQTYPPLRQTPGTQKTDIPFHLLARKFIPKPTTNWKALMAVQGTNAALADKLWGRFSTGRKTEELRTNLRTLFKKLKGGLRRQCTGGLVESEMLLFNNYKKLDVILDSLKDIEIRDNDFDELKRCWDMVCSPLGVKL